MLRRENQGDLFDDQVVLIGGSYDRRYQGPQHDEAVMFKLGHYSPPIPTSVQDFSKMQPRLAAQFGQP